MILTPLNKFLVLFFMISSVTSAIAQSQVPFEKRTCIDHKMQYYISLPKNWSKEKFWPVVIAIEGASKEYKENIMRFNAERGQLPFILIVPINVTNGNQGLKDPTIFPYSQDTWKYIDQVGTCDFDLQGIQNIIKDVHALFKGEQKFFITGFEAGAHLMWAVTFQHPELVHAAVAVSGNYRNRCMENYKFGQPGTNRNIPIRAFSGSRDSLAVKGGVFHQQWIEAKMIAESHGYIDVKEIVINDKQHVPLPKEILNYFLDISKN
jgi:predicted peptidase